MQSAARTILVFLVPGLLQGLFGTPYARAQTPEYQFEHFPELGIISWSVHQDSQGFLWIASWEGLFRYDGYTFRKYVHAPGDTTTLASNNVFRVYEDRRGTLWAQTIGTDRREALHRYHRETDTFTRLTASVDSLGGRNARVWSFFEDRAGTLWLGSEQGLFRYDQPTQTFVRHAPASGVLDGASVRAIHEDREGALWLGVHGRDPKHLLWNTGTEAASRLDVASRVAGANGLVRFGPSRKTHARFAYDPADPASIGPGGVNAILEDSRGRFWVGTAEGGLCRMDRGREAFSCYRHDPADPESVSHDNITSIEEDDAGMLWVGTEGGGLNRFDPERRRFERFTYDASRPDNTVPGGDIEQVYRDRTGVLWVATWGGGLSKLSRATPLFSTYAPPSHDTMMGNVLEDRAGDVWIGMRDGLHRLDRKTGRWTSFRSEPDEPGSLSATFASGMQEDRTGVLWVGTWGGGLNRYDPETGTFTHFRHDPHDLASLNDDRIRTVHEDRSGRLWIGTFTGLNLMDRDAGTFTRFVNDPDDSTTISAGIVGPILEDREGRIWVGMEIGGVSRMEGTSGTFTHFRSDAADPQSLSSDWVVALYEDREGRIWVGTNDGGLNRFDPDAHVFTHFDQTNSCLPSDRIMRVMEDRAGYLWLNTGGGVVRFDPERQSCIAYDTRDGLLDPRGYFGGHQSPSGEIFFPVFGGAQSFHPERVTLNAEVPRVALTDLRVSRQSVAPGPASPLQEQVAVAEEVVLAHDENDVEFEFAALHFVRPDRNRYAYRLEGYDGDWVESGAQRTATYTNLPPGTYTFRVKAANSDGAWNEEGASIRMHILPPWWRTSWAYFLYGLVFVAGVWAAGRVQRRRLIRRERTRAQIREAELRAEALEAENRRQEVELEKARELEALNVQLKAHEAQLEAQNRKLRELDEMKSRFFANISHEFRTPLTLILGPLEDALASEASVDVRQLGIMRRSARRLLRLIGQLLDLSKLEAGSMRLHLQRADLVPFLRRLVTAFSSRAEREDISLSFAASPGQIPLCFDPDKLEKVVVNLLSNAFKFTPARGKIHVGAQVVASGSAPCVEIRVQDTGVGIPAQQQPFVFDRFFQVDATATRWHEGTGIGLALSKELVALHGGTIRVESQVGFGTTFSVRLPVHAAEEADEDLDAGRAEEVAFRCAERPDEPEISPPEETPRAPEEAPMVLLVEDNTDVRTYLRTHLQGRYRVVEAADGAEGLDLARRRRPDLVVSDVMMPRRDGFSLCLSLKTDPELNHIPVILLTARAGEESKLEGLETGADDYLTKPFGAEELLARVENLIVGRRRLRERFSSEVVLRPHDVAVPSADAVFVERVRAVVEAHMGDAHFSVEWLAAEVGVSPRQLHRRMRELTDLSPVGFVRMMRLERAAQLLRQQAGSVAEVSHAVGFSSTSYFARLFRQTFGASPSEFAAASEPQIGQN